MNVEIRPQVDGYIEKIFVDEGAYVKPGQVRVNSWQLLVCHFLGIDNNICVQVGLIMLIGLLAKNAILIVEYAVQRRRAGMTLLDAAPEASSLRLRPILMTSFAFIVGILSLMYATGSSAMGNRSISTRAVGGMLTGYYLVYLLFLCYL